MARPLIPRSFFSTPPLRQRAPRPDLWPGLTRQRNLRADGTGRAVAVFSSPPLGHHHHLSVIRGGAPGSPSAQARVFIRHEVGEPERIYDGSGTAFMLYGAGELEPGDQLAIEWTHLMPHHPVEAQLTTREPLS